MTRTTPRRRTTRQRSHIGFTDALTFTLYSRVVSNQLRRRPAGPMNRARGHKKTAPWPIENGSRARSPAGQGRWVRLISDQAGNVPERTKGVDSFDSLGGIAGSGAESIPV